MGARLVISAATALAAVVAIAACGGDDDGDEASAGSGGDNGAMPCREVEQPAPKQVDLDRPRNLRPAGGTITVETSCGTFTIEPDVERAPKTVASFENLVVEGVYDGTAFHRVVPDFVIQGGDPSGDGTGGPGYSVDERPPSNLSYTRGVVAMAKTEAEPPGRSGSQFFIVVGADAGLPPDFALVGEVGEGMDVVERIAALGEPGSDGPPSMPVVVERMTLEER